MNDDELKVWIGVGMAAFATLALAALSAVAVLR